MSTANNRGDPSPAGTSVLILASGAPLPVAGNCTMSRTTTTRSESARWAGVSGSARSELAADEALGSAFWSPHEAARIDASRMDATLAHDESVIGGASLTDSPRVAELAKLQEYRSRVRLIRQIGKCLAQSRDDGRARQAEERVDASLDLECRDHRVRGILFADAVEHVARGPVVRFAVERETQ